LSHPAVVSVPFARLPDIKNEGRDQSDHDKHPVLGIETQKGEMLDEKWHRSVPVRRRICASATKIYYFYTFIEIQTDRNECRPDL
jgi:hypothetical protein